ncbi:2Fe-2S iron-sulfur cluster-binding protein [Spirillospora sp. NPDC029432]|uniref:MOSC domain-containing protein n=1 Tax=Spirillospora sp. NPDC029432 TaxID=3154599 RepID=UPI0034531A17
MSVPYIARLVRYPVKGFPGQEVERGRVRPGAGLPFDRAVAFASGRLPPPEAGGWVPSRTWRTLVTDPGPLRGGVELDEAAGIVRIRHPEYGTLTVPLGKTGPVEPPEGTAGWFGGTAVVHRAADGFWDDPDGGVSLINLASVAALGRAAGADLDPLRFRGNVYLEGLPPWAELDLVGERIAIGDVELEVLHPINRCAATSANPASAVRDHNVPALLAAHMGHIYCGLRAKVVTGGTLAKGAGLVRTGTKVRPKRAEGGPEPSSWPRYARIVRREPHGPDTVSLWLADPLAALRGAPEAGQHILVHTSDEDGPVWRAYTVSAHEDDLLRVTVRNVGRMSALLHGPAERVLISGPNGGTVLDAGADRPLLLASAGVGITQTLAMLRECARRRPDRPLLLLHTVRRGSDLALWDEATELIAGMPHARARLFLTGEAPEAARRLGATPGRPDFSGAAVPGTVAYLCGPLPFMDAAERTLTAAGADVHREVFASPGAVPAEPSGPPAPGPFRVDFTASGVTADWRPEDGTLLELAESLQVPVRAGCRAGACRMCRRPVTRGETAHTVPPALPPGDGHALLCSAVPVTDIAVDA